jgi:hypothetical protein
MPLQITKDARRLLATLSCCATLAAPTGCVRLDGDPATPAFVPTWAEARRSLDSSLAAWRDGPSPLPDTFDIPGVQFVDKTRKPQQRLSSFQILGQTEIENARQFTVRLIVDGEESPQLVKYNMVGKNPIWVFRLDDYEMFAHWEHDMQPPAQKAGESGKSGLGQAPAN